MKHALFRKYRELSIWQQKDFTSIVAELGRNKDENNNPLLCRDEQMGFPFGLFFHSTAASKIDSDVLTVLRAVMV